MASLYESTKNARRVLFGVLIFIGVILAFTVYGNLTYQDPIVGDTGRSRFYIDFNRIFDSLEKASIPGITYNENARFSLESVHTNPYPDSAFVYRIERPRERLSSLRDAENTALSLGFIADQYNRSEGQLTWAKDENTKTLQYDLNSRIWELDTLYLDNDAALSRKNLFDEDTIPALEQSYAQRLSNIVSDIGLESFGFGEAQIEITMAQRGLDGFFVDVDQVSQAEYAYAAIHRTLPLSELKSSSELPQGIEPPPEPGLATVYSDDPREGQLNLVVSNRVRSYGEDIFEMNFTDYEYDEANIGVYPVLSPSEAWSEIANGGGSLVLLERGNSNYFANTSNVSVTEFSADAQQTELAYYESSNWTGYTIPIFVFRGIAQLENGELANFMFVIDAIKRAET